MSLINQNISINYHKMNTMKKTILTLISLLSVVGLASASNDFSYTASGDPNSNPDGVDQSANPVNVWNVTTTPGGTNSLGDSGADGSGSYYGTQDTLTGWQLYSFQNDGANNGGSAIATTTFAGGALTIGQTVSINFNMRALDNPSGTAGIDLFNGFGAAITFEINGGGSYNYTDAGSTGASAGSMGYQYQNPFNIAFTITGAGTYSN